MGSDIAFKPAADLIGMLRRGRVSSLELVDYFIDRIEEYDGALNAVVVRDFDRARKKARKSDRDRAAGKPLGPLAGLPMTVKESLQVAGLPTTWGSAQFHDNISAETAIAVQRLEAAGAIVMGKTNVALFLGDYQSYNPEYGTAHNPYDLARTPGGSSGGAAAAVAAGLTGAELGSDLAGSVRVPASFCGVYAHKPSYGTAPTIGHSIFPSPVMPDLSVLGPIARSARDLELLFSVVQGPDPLAARGWALRLPKRSVQSLEGLRVGVMVDVEGARVAESVRKGVQALARWMRREGAKVGTVKPPMPVAEHDVLFHGILKAVLAGRMDEPTYRARMAQADLLAADDVSPSAVAIRDFTQTHWQWAQRNAARTALRLAWEKIFEKFDVVLLPGTPLPGFPIDESEPASARVLDMDGRKEPYDVQWFWQGMASLSYLPSTVAPVGMSPDGMPVSVQILGPYLDDNMTIGVAKLIEKFYHAYEPPEGYETE